MISARFPTRRNVYRDDYRLVVDCTGLEQQRRRPLPAAETGRSCWGSVLIFQSPARGLRKNQQMQPVRPRRFPTRRNVYRDDYRLVVDGTGREQPRTAMNKGRVSSWRWYPAFRALWRIWGQSLRTCVHGQYSRTQEKGEFLTYRGGLSAGGMIYLTRQIGIQGGSVMRTEKKSHRSRMDPIVVLVLIFAVLKVTGLISWSWLWVLSPIWITLLIFAAIFSSILVGGRIVKGKW